MLQSVVVVAMFVKILTGMAKTAEMYPPQLVKAILLAGSAANFALGNLHGLTCFSMVAHMVRRARGEDMKYLFDSLNVWSLRPELRLSYNQP